MTEAEKQDTADSNQEDEEPSTSGAGQQNGGSSDRFTPKSAGKPNLPFLDFRAGSHYSLMLNLHIQQISSFFNIFSTK